MKTITGIVPLRANSRRVPKKNLKNFAGRPLYHRIIDTLLKTNSITHVVIDTNSEEIKKDAESNFPEVIIIDRPEELSSEFTPVNDILKYDIDQVNTDIYLQTHATNPLLRNITIENAILKFLEFYPKFNSLFSVTRMFERYWNEDWKPVNHDPKVLIRTQDLPPFYLENSCFYMFTKQTLFENNSRISNTPYLFEISALEAVDIDEEIDFEYAEFLYKKQYS